MILFPYKNGSQGANELAAGLNIKQIKKNGSRFKGGPEKLVINWGNSMSTDEVDKCAVLNKPAAVAICSNKLNFFRHIRNMNQGSSAGDWTNIPEWGTNMGWARDWIASGEKIVCRTVLNGHSGDGIVIASNNEELVKAPLYVVYQPKKSEYRVHVLAGEVVDVQRKARDQSIPNDQVNWQIRNHQFGFVFVRDEDISNIPKPVLTDALNAVKMCGLDFGAVDVIYNQKMNSAYVLEINTAPGLTGTTLAGYQERLAAVGKEYAEIISRKKYKSGRIDIGMFDLDPLEAALHNWRQQVREAPHPAHNPVVAEQQANGGFEAVIHHNEVAPAPAGARARARNAELQAGAFRGVQPRPIGAGDVGMDAVLAAGRRAQVGFNEALFVREAIRDEVMHGEPDPFDF